MRLEILAARDKLLRFLGAIQRSEPDLPVPDVSDGSARRNVRRMACVNAFGIAARPGDGPNRLLSAGRIAGGIGYLTGGVFASAADIDHNIRTRGEAQLGEFLTVVFVVFCELARGELGSLGGPDVSLALLIEDPSQPITALSRNQIRRKWGAQNLFQREHLLGFGARAKNKRTQGHTQGKAVHPFLLLK